MITTVNGTVLKISFVLTMQNFVSVLHIVGCGLLRITFYLKTRNEKYIGLLLYRIYLSILE